MISLTLKTTAGSLLQLMEKGKMAAKGEEGKIVRTTNGVLKKRKNKKRSILKKRKNKESEKYKNVVKKEQR